MSIRNLLAGLAFATVALVSGVASADETTWCQPGDTQMGPNCVHTVQDPDAPNVPDNVVYRMSGSDKKVVWMGVGQVQSSTAKALKVLVILSGSGGGESGREIRTYKWNGSSYVGSN